jgi:hypothetical protein
MRRPLESRTPLPANILRQAAEFSSDYLPTDTRPSDPDLAAVIFVWPRLPDPIKAAIAALIQSVR